MNKIFQPILTTKLTGQACPLLFSRWIELGLSLSYVKSHAGEFTVETKEGEGTEFVIQLPIV